MRSVLKGFWDLSEWYVHSWIHEPSAEFHTGAASAGLHARGKRLTEDDRSRDGLVPLYKHSGNLQHDADPHAITETTSA